MLVDYLYTTILDQEFKEQQYAKKYHLKIQIRRNVVKEATVISPAGKQDSMFFHLLFNSQQFLQEKLP